MYVELILCNDFGKSEKVVEKQLDETSHLSVRSGTCPVYRMTV